MGSRAGNPPQFHHLDNRGGEFAEQDALLMGWFLWAELCWNLRTWKTVWIENATFFFLEWKLRRVLLHPSCKQELAGDPYPATCFFFSQFWLGAEFSFATSPCWWCLSIFSWLHFRAWIRWLLMPISCCPLASIGIILGKENEPCWTSQPKKTSFLFDVCFSSFFLPLFRSSDSL